MIDDNSISVNNITSELCVSFVDNALFSWNKWVLCGVSKKVDWFKGIELCLVALSLVISFVEISQHLRCTLSRTIEEKTLLSCAYCVILLFMVADSRSLFLFPMLIFWICAFFANGTQVCSILPRTREAGAQVLKAWRYSDFTRIQFFLHFSSSEMFPRDSLFSQHSK